jgi:hypothetical protein
LIGILLLAYLINATSAIKIPSAWLSNLSSFAGGGVGGMLYHYFVCLCMN